MEWETREEQIRRLEASGDLDPKCATCRAEVYDHPRKLRPSEVHMPPHRASRRCESGKRAHCTCGTCW